MPSDDSIAAAVSATAREPPPLPPLLGSLELQSALGAPLPCCTSLPFKLPLPVPLLPDLLLMLMSVPGSMTAAPGLGPSSSVGSICRGLSPCRREEAAEDLLPRQSAALPATGANICAG